ncbi:MAG: amidase family protein [Thermoanaerobaculia bacterium]|nr:amidase family protein [Thermoanaerobaculia bacterium]
MRQRYVGLLVVVLLVVACQGQEPGEGAVVDESTGGFEVVEATIAEIHQAMEAGELTARQLVEMYLARIEAYDKQGPAFNSIVVVNPEALARADELDAAFRESGFVGPLHGIPVIVKDNYDTYDLPTSAGSLALAESIPPDDAFQVERIRAAGGIVIAKSNMAEWAFSPYETVGSALPGYSRNPYDTSRVTAGSSGGTGAAVAASFGTVGLGTDTGNSIRGPSSHNLLVGIRSTMGLTSRDGIVPLYLDHDIGGPMCRSVADAVALFDVIAGHDAADPVTEAAKEKKEGSYSAHLVADGLAGARIGVVRQLVDVETADQEIRKVFQQALEDLRAAGAEVVDPITVEELDTIPQNERWCPRFRYDLENYLASLGPNAPVKTIDDILQSGQYHPSVESGLRYFHGIEGAPEDSEVCRTAWASGLNLAQGVRDVLAEHRLDALVYPTWINRPRLIGDLNTPAGDNSQDLSPHTGFPAITVPMGFVGDHLPVGLSILGDAWTEGRLIELAYSYEQATKHRKPPASAPPL